MSRRIVWVVCAEGTASGVFSTKAAAMKAARQYVKSPSFSKPSHLKARHPHGVSERFIGDTEDGDWFDVAVTPHEVKS